MHWDKKVEDSDSAAGFDQPPAVSARLVLLLASSLVMEADQCRIDLAGVQSTLIAYV